MLVSRCFFFFQAEDGIRDYKVTGVQTCALPIYSCDDACQSESPGDSPVANPVAHHVAGMVGTVPQSRRMVFLYVAAGAGFATVAARGVTVPLYAHDLGATRVEVGARFSGATPAAALLFLPAGQVVRRVRAR